MAQGINGDELSRSIWSDPRVREAWEFASRQSGGYRGGGANAYALFQNYLKEKFGIADFNSTFKVPDGYHFNPQGGPSKPGVFDDGNPLVPYLGAIGAGGFLGAAALAGGAGAGGGGAMPTATAPGMVSSSALPGTQVASVGMMPGATAPGVVSSAALPGTQVSSIGLAPSAALPSTPLASGAASYGLPSGVASGGGAATAAATASKVGSGFSIFDYIPEMMGAGAAVYGASRQAGAVEKAAEIQGQAADDALAYEKEIYGQQRRDTAPYRYTGQASISEMARLAGLDLGPFSVADAAPAESATETRGQTLAALRDIGEDARANSTSNASIGYGPGTQGREALDAMRRSPEWQRLADLKGQQQTQSSFVRMRAPDGNEGMVPANRVADAEAQGGVRI